MREEQGVLYNQANNLKCSVAATSIAPVVGACGSGRLCWCGTISYAGAEF